MNQVRNYQKELDKIIERLTQKGEVPTLLLHSCCAPCSSYCLEYLRQYFKITVFYYNPNISMEEEYRKRVAEQKRLIAAYNAQNIFYPIEVIEGDYDTDAFFAIERLSSEYHIPWLVSDFKKKNGYKRSIELSAEYELYRQDYCGCIYSKMERESQKKERT